MTRCRSRRYPVDRESSWCIEAVLADGARNPLDWRRLAGDVGVNDNAAATFRDLEYDRGELDGGL
jgi:hypothetical protein